MSNEEALELKQVISKEMEAWAAEFIVNRVNFLQKRRIDTTGELVRSLNFEINNAARAEAVELLLAFNDYGRMIDMKRFNYQHDGWGRNAVERVEDWIKAKGLEKFLPGYVKKYKMKTVPANVLNRIAWGIMTNRANGKFRRKDWYNKAKSGALNDLFNNVASKITNKVAKQLTKGFDPKKYAQAKGRE